MAERETKSRLSQRLPQILLNVAVINYLKAEIPSEERLKLDASISHIKTECTNNGTVKPVSQVNLMKLSHYVVFINQKE